MLKKALVVLYFVEAAYLLVPWQAVAYRHLDLSRNEGIITWLGAPGFYVLARLTMRYGPTLWMRLAAFGWTVVWLLVAALLNPDPHGFGPRNFLLASIAAWIVIANGLTIVGPLIAASMLGKRGLEANEVNGPSSFFLGCIVCSSATLLALTLLLGGPGKPLGGVGIVLAAMMPIALMSPLLALVGLMKALFGIDVGSRRRRMMGAGLNGAFLVFLAVLIAQGKL